MRYGGGWKSGWIGAAANSEYLWQWDSGPERGQSFWRGASHEVGIREADNAQIGPSKVTMVQINQRDPNVHWRKRPLWNGTETGFRFTSFSAGTPQSNGCDTHGSQCQPQRIPGKTRLAIFGGRGGGLWFPTEDNVKTCQSQDIDNICGHYVEWGGMTGDPDVRMALAETIDVAAHRQHCRPE